MTKLYTLGYRLRSQEGLLTVLSRNEIKLLVDVRDMARSRKPGFAKSTLSWACSARCIKYIHYPELGIPKKERDKIKTQDDIEGFWLDYIRKLGGLGDTIGDLIDFIKAKPTCLLCYEREPECCHRKVLAEYLEGMIPGLKVIHL